MRRVHFIRLCWFLLVVAVSSVAQVGSPSTGGANGFALTALEPPRNSDSEQSPVSISVTTPVQLPRMAPELALQAFRGRTVVQSAQLASYSATTIIRAQLLDSNQSAEFELERHYSAPRTLAFKALHFTGDAFVKSNVIVRLLQSEVDHVQKDDPTVTAISPANYKFSYKGTRDLDSRMVHVYQVKPRQKRAGLFRGQIFLDAYSGSIVRAEGKLVKSPSLFIKKVEFAQDFVDINSFTFPVHMHSEALARVVGRAVVDIYDSDYRTVGLETAAQAANHGF